MARTITIGKGTENERAITSTGEKDPRGFETFRGPGGEKLTKQGDKFIVGRARQITPQTTQAASSVQGTDPIANVFSDPSSTVKQKFAANITTLLTRMQENQATFRTDVRERGSDLRGQQADIISEPTPEDLRDLSPDQQRAIRNAQVGAKIDPEVNALQRQSAFQEELFKAGAQVLDQAVKLGEDLFPETLDPKAVANFASLVERGQISMADVPASFAPSVIAAINPDNFQMSETDKLQLEKLKAGIDLTRAQTAKALRGPVGAKDRIIELQGGLFNVEQNRFIVEPKPQQELRTVDGDVVDINTGNVVFAGQPDESDALQFLATVEPNTKTRGELEDEIRALGVDPNSDAIQDGIDSVNTSSSIRKLLGF